MTPSVTFARDDVIERLHAVKAAPLALFCVVAAVAGLVLPNGLPIGVVAQGLVLGGLSSLTAMGLVLIYRSARIINFAQAEIGGLAASLAVILVAGKGLPYFVALPIGLASAVAVGALIDATVIRRFFTAPRLILTVATVGLAQILGAAQIVLPSLVTDLRPLTSFTTPFDVTFRIGPMVFTGDHVVAAVTVPVVLAGLVWFFGRSDAGIAIRGAADSNERAILLGIPVRRLSRMTWMIAAGLSGIASMLTTPILGAQLGSLAGPTILLTPLAAAVLARMESLPIAFSASMAIAVFQQAVFWSYPRSSAVDVGLFVVVLAALLLQRRKQGRVTDAGLGGYVAVREVRPIPDELSGLPELRLARIGGLGLLAVGAVIVPLALSNSQLVFMAFIAIYAILGVSLVVLTGWAGQISLGQFAFAGIGGATAASLMVHGHLDLFVSMLAAATAGAVVALVVGVPAMRLSGPFLAVTTLAFGVPVSSYFLNAQYFPSFNPAQLARPQLFSGRIDLGSPQAFYFFCLLWLVATYLVARNLRRSRVGRTIIGTRDNERAAAGFSIEPTRAKMTAFAVSGAMAGLAGALYVTAVRGVPFSGFSPVISLQIFTMVVIGGLGSLPGAIIGAAYVQGAQYFLSGAAQLLATGAGLLLLLMVAPGGIGHLVYTVRDRVLRWVAVRRDLAIPSLTERPDAAGSGPELRESAGPLDSRLDGSRADAPGSGSPGFVSLRNVDTGYGSVQVLFGVDLDVADGEVVALLGTNGAGKSTVLRALSGLNDAWGAGTDSVGIEIDGVDIATMDPADRVANGLVMVPGGRGVFGSLSVAENLRLATWLTRDDPEFVERTHAHVLELFPPLAARMDQAASSLSGGEQQMLTLAQALLCRPRVLLIDELSLGLAPTIVSMLIEVVRDINASGVTVIVVEQSVNVALELAERAVFMERGTVRFTGPTADLVDRPDLLRSVFLNDAAALPPTDQRRPRLQVASKAGGAPVEDGPPAFEVNGISKSFGGVAAVSDVSFRAEANRVLGIIGSNGAGKTTMFDICSGFLAADRGRLTLHGIDITSMSAAERAERGLGRSFQDARLFPTMTVAECVETAIERHTLVRDPVSCALSLGAADDSEQAVRDRAAELVARMGLERYRNAFISELSTGTRRIVELACAVAHEPSVLLLDEPAGGVAQREIETLAQVLQNVREVTGATLVVIEHDIPFISSLADDLVCMHLGMVIAEGRPTDVLADPEVVASYLGTNEAAIHRSGTGSRNGSSRRARSRPLTAPRV